MSTRKNESRRTKATPRIVSWPGSATAVDRVLRTRWVGFIMMLGVFGSISVSAQDTDEFFEQNCMSCHTIGGGRVTGPDLKDVTKRKDTKWLMNFMVDPKKVLDSGDPYALMLKKASNNVVMPKIKGLDSARAKKLLALIENESKKEKSKYKGMQVSDEPFTAADVARGRTFFMGQKRLVNLGSSCISCHNIGGLSGLRGGRLGPDLSLVYERLGGRVSLSQFLVAPAGPTMKTVFKDHPMDPEEIKALVAFFEHSAKQGDSGDNAGVTIFAFLGLMGAVIVMVLLDLIWKNRFRAVRRTLLRGEAH